MLKNYRGALQHAIAPSIPHLWDTQTHSQSGTVQEKLYHLDSITSPNFMKWTIKDTVHAVQREGGYGRGHFPLSLENNFLWKQPTYYNTTLSNAAFALSRI